MHNSTLMSHFLQTLERPGNNHCRCNIVAGLIYLSSGSPKVKEAMCKEGVLDNMLSMLRSPSARGVAVDFLQMISPLFRKEFDLIQAQQYTKQSRDAQPTIVDSKAACDIILIFQSENKVVQTIRTHRSIFVGSSKIREMLVGAVAKSRESCVRIHIEEKFHIFEYAVKHLYHRSASTKSLGSMPFELLLELYGMSMRYEFGSVYQDCRRSIMHRICNSTVLLVFRSALDLNDRFIQTVAFQFVQEQDNLIDVIRRSKKNVSLLIGCLAEFIEKTAVQIQPREVFE